MNSLVQSHADQSGLQLIYLDLSFNQMPRNTPTWNQPPCCKSVNWFSSSRNGSIRVRSELVLLGNQLCGHMSASLGDLRCLTFQFSHQSNLSGSIPPEMGKFSNLVELYVDTNYLSGHIPNKIYKVNYVLHVPKSTFCSESRWNQILEVSPTAKPLRKPSFRLFPAAIGGLRNFTHLRLYKNQLSGSLPEELGNLESFVDLELGNNQSSGPVPASIGNLTNLEVYSSQQPTLRLYFWREGIS